ncbi:MAG: hypothetical protein HUK01_00360 [Bacteroidaceae bacterium]|nr:hypothetical protein [Bacteroidaceae bacterium]
MRFWQADTYKYDDEFLELVHEYEQSLSEGSVPYLDADDLTDIAEYYCMKRRYTEASVAIDRALEMDPEATAPLCYMVREYIAQDDWEKARATYNCITDTDDREAMYLRVEIALHDGDTKLASSILEANYPSHDTAEEQRTYLREVIGLLLDYEGCEVEEMLSSWGKCLSNMEGLTSEDRMMIAEMLAVTTQDCSAVVWLEKLLEEEPFNQMAWLLMFDIEMRTENIWFAENAVNYALAIDDHNLRAIMSQAWLFGWRYQNILQVMGETERGMEMSKKVHDDCMECMERAVLCGLNDNDEFFATAAEIFHRIEEGEQEIYYMKRDLEVRPYNSETRLNLGYAYVDADDYAQALEYLMPLTERPTSCTPESYAPIAFCLFKLHRFDECVGYLKKSEQEYPDSATTFFEHIFPHAKAVDYAALVDLYFGSRV